MFISGRKGIRALGHLFFLYINVRKEFAGNKLRETDHKLTIDLDSNYHKKIDFLPCL